MHVPSKLLHASLVLACHACGTASPRASPGFPTLITHASQRGAAVGTLVTVVGRQTGMMYPTVVGIDVDGDDTLSDVEVRGTGRLDRHVIPPDPPDLPALVCGRRAPGTYYRLVKPDTGLLARTYRARGTR